MLGNPSGRNPWYLVPGNVMDRTKTRKHYFTVLLHFQNLLRPNFQVTNKGGLAGTKGPGHFSLWGPSDRCYLTFDCWKTFPVGFIVYSILYYCSQCFKDFLPSRLHLKATVHHIWRAQKQRAGRAFARCARPAGAPLVTNIVAWL